jgi:bifunctional DNA-binding transcriptional regulator/antitoxin component of YhaV-PrlF toxin-antitoxin module
MYNSRPLEIIRVGKDGLVVIPENIRKIANIKDDALFAIYVEVDGGSPKLIWKQICTS